MADISITATGVLASSAAEKTTGTAGAAITAGQVVYLDTSDNKWKLADANVAASSTAALGIALNSAPASGQPVEVCTYDSDFTPGGTLSITAPAAAVWLSATAGGITQATATDVVATMYPVVLGIAKSTSKMVFRPVQGPTVLT